MRVYGFTTTRPNGSATRTYEDFSKFLGDNPARLGIVANLYSQYTALHLTEALMNVWTKGVGKGGFKSIDNFMVEWGIKVNRIHRVNIISAEGDGANKADILFKMPENYYQKYDVFIVEDTRQQFRVVNRPQRISDNCFLVIAQIHDGDYSSEIVGDLTGKSTRFMTNYMPELHEEGYTRYQSNTELHRAFIGTQRADVDMSAKYAAMETNFIGISKGDKDNPQYYQMQAAEKDCLDSFMEARNNALLWGKTNLDKNMKPTAYDNEVGRPIIAGDGIIAQVERFATKFMFNKLNVSWFKKALNAMNQKSEKSTGNNYIFLCNTLMWNDVQNVLDAWLKDYATDGTFLYSKGENGYMNVGATYQSYTWAGNTVTFRIDRSFDIEYPDRKFGVMLDLTPDGQKGHAAINLLTFKGGQYIHNWILGVGGKNGLSSGQVSSPVAGNKHVMWGYSGVAVYAPYRSVIMMSDKVKNMMF